jgi:hypothetical protein
MNIKDVKNHVLTLDLLSTRRDINLDATNVTKRTMTDTSTSSRSCANQLSSKIGAQAQIPVVHIGIQAQGTSGVTNTVGNSRALAMTTDSSYTEFAGFGVIDRARAHSLSY